MSAEKTEHGTTKGLAIIVAAVVAFAAIVGASAIVAKKPAPREDFLAGLPEERPRAPEAPAAAVEEDVPEEEPRPAELIARAEKLVADGSRDRGQIEGLLQAAVRARPGADESTRAFKLLLDLYEKWREEDSRSVPVVRAELPRPPAPPPPPVVAPPRPAAPAAAPTPGFVSLIGTDLSGWGNPTGGTWKLEGGAILGDCLNVSGFLYTRKRFRDFTLKLRVTGLATSGYAPHLKVRFRWVPEKGKYGCQTDLTTKAYFYAAIVGDDKPEEQVFDVSTGLRPTVGTSVEVELVAIGESVTMLVNGREIYAATAKITEPGLLGICAHRSSILFEKVEIKEH